MGKGMLLAAVAAVALTGAVLVYTREAPASLQSVTLPDPLTQRAGGCVGAGWAVTSLYELARNDPRPEFYSGVGDLTRKVATTVPTAQAYFDQGLRMFYAFNMREAFRAFRAAAEADPACAPCHWGVALALGVNINQTAQPELDLKIANEHLAKAASVAATDLDKGLVAALKARFDPGATQAARNDAYARQMWALADRYPNDPDLQVLTVDAEMNRSPWAYWAKDGKAVRPEITRAQAALERMLAPTAFPDHMGVIHWYIHLLEGSTQVGKVLPWADKLAGYAPAAGHLVHMPAHIYYRVGEHAKAKAWNRAAVYTDEAYFESVSLAHPDGDRYRFGYYRHNIHFLVASSVISGSDGDVRWAADRLLKTAPANGNGFRADYYRAAGFQALTPFAEPEEILSWTEPVPDQIFARIAWRWSRALAHVWRKDGRTARAELDALRALAKRYAPSGPGDVTPTVIGMMDALTDARILELERNPRDAIAAAERAVELQDSLPYDEPPHWFVPAAQTMAAIMIGTGDRGMAQQAEKWLRATFGTNEYDTFHGNGWAWFGIVEAMKVQGRTDPAKDPELKKALDMLDRTWMGSHRHRTLARM